jgi:ABC-type proline/glycine betaine transport system permease subunit
VQVFAGAFLVAVLALLIEAGLAWAQHLLVSPGLVLSDRARTGFGRAR